MTKPINIIIADTQFLVIDSLTRLIESTKKYNIIDIADCRYNLIKSLQINKPTLLIVDPNHIDFEDLNDLKTIAEEFKSLSVLILTNILSTSEIKKLTKAGINNISLKTDEKDEILFSIEAAIHKKKHFSEEILDILLSLNEQKENHTGQTNLTQSETEIVKMIADGYTTKEIALKKHLSYHTVITHRKNIFRKLEINNVSELVKFAIRKGLIDNIEYNI